MRVRAHGCTVRGGLRLELELCVGAGRELKSSGRSEQALKRPVISPAAQQLSKLLLLPNENKVQAESGNELPRVPRGPAAHEPQLPEPHLPAASGAHDELRIPRHAGSPRSHQRTATLPSAFARRPRSSGNVRRSQSQPRSLVHQGYLLHLSATERPESQMPYETRNVKRRGGDMSSRVRRESCEPLSVGPQAKAVAWVIADRE